MNIFKISLQAAAKRPIIIIIPAVLSLVFFAVNSYNPLMTVLLGITSATGGTFFDGIISILQLLMDPSVIPVAAIFAAVAVLLLSLGAGLVFSGYFHIIRNTLQGIDKAKGDFRTGIGKYFLKITVITLKASIIAGIISAVMIVATVPAIIITRAAFVTKPELMAAAVFVDILTAIVLFFAYMFVKIYLLYWYPAAINDISKPFLYAKRLVDRSFFKIILKLLVFDIVLSASVFLYIIIPSSIVELLFGWIFAACFATVLVIYVFHSFGEIMSSDNEDDRS